MQDLGISTVLTIGHSTRMWKPRKVTSGRKLGIILGVSMFFGALLGTRIALFLSTVWLRRTFIAATLGLAVKVLLPAH
jgi:uncharacterized membrane protein YfcA